jgi:radical SAM-linked protein
MSVKLRLKYSKTGRAKYISHLDLSTTMHRALLRAETMLKYSEGFNPHPYISVALPLKVGDESVCELLDFAVSDGFTLPEDFAQKLSSALPEGIEVYDVYTSQRKFSQIAWVYTCGSLLYKDTDSNFAAELKERFSAEEIIISKKSKSGVSEINIAPFVKDVEFCHDEKSKKINMSAKISALNPSLSPENIISALDGQYRRLMPQHYTFSRVEFLDADYLPFY